MPLFARTVFRQTHWTMSDDGMEFAEKCEIAMELEAKFLSATDWCS